MPSRVETSHNSLAIVDAFQTLVRPCNNTTVVYAWQRSPIDKLTAKWMTASSHCGQFVTTIKPDVCCANDGFLQILRTAALLPFLSCGIRVLIIPNADAVLLRVMIFNSVYRSSNMYLYKWRGRLMQCRMSSLRAGRWIFNCAVPPRSLMTTNRFFLC